MVAEVIIPIPKRVMGTSIAPDVINAIALDSIIETLLNYC